MKGDVYHRNKHKFDHDLAREMYADGAKQSELAKFFGVSDNSMMMVLKPEKRAEHAARVRARKAT